jgi:SAM-dependent methyltransferase
MYRSIYDLAEFYKHPMGKITQRVVRSVMARWWKDCHALRVVGIGYAQPYLDLFLPTAERCLAIIPARLGGQAWPSSDKNLICLAEESELPLETNSVDRVILIHSVEHAELLSSNLQEVWRILKGNGRLLVVTPNRMGFWARAVWSPFGQGSPSTLDQLRWQLREHKFVYERHTGALYTPPLRFRWIEASSKTFEICGPFLCPALAGLHIVEASKQVYAGIESGGGSKVAIRGRASLTPQTSPSQFDDAEK